MKVLSLILVLLGSCALAQEPLLVLGGSWTASLASGQIFRGIWSAQTSIKGSNRIHAKSQKPNSVDHPSQTIKNEVTRSPKIELIRSVSRMALLRLDDCPTDQSAVDALWEENHVAIELEMKCHLHSSTNPALLNQPRVAQPPTFRCDFSQQILL
jgi:hypothetical protein